METTTTTDLDRAVERLAESRRRWGGLDVRKRVEILGRLTRDTLAVAPEMVAAACKAKGIDLDGPTAAEEWLGGPMTILRNLRLLAESLEQIEGGGRPRLAQGAIRTRSGGGLAVKVFPGDWKDSLLFSGFSAEVWMDPTVTEEELPRTMARVYQGGPKAEDGKVALVLGAGNVASIGPMDVLYKLFVENQVVVLKMNPVNDYLGPFIERSFSVLVDAGYLQVVYGGAEAGDHLVCHEAVETIHITGSDRVHDLIVWGPDPAAAKAAGRRRVDKPVTSELGCVTPVVVVPGEWSDKELDFQAQNVATMVANNASFNCNAAKVLVTSRDWPQRTAFLDRLEEILGGLRPRTAYYPGSQERYERFLATYPEARRLVDPRQGTIPWTVQRDVDAQGDQMAFGTEAWCAFLAETALPGDAGEFLTRAVDFCNDRLWGTLSMSILVDPRTARRLGGAVETAIAALRYGSVVVNHWAAVSYGLVVTTWGAYPGHTLEDIGSGIGVVHNTLLFDRPLKSVVKGPFTAFPKPPWFTTHGNAHKVAPRITRYEASPSFLQIPGIAAAAALG